MKRVALEERWCSQCDESIKKKSSFLSWTLDKQTQTMCMTCAKEVKKLVEDPKPNSHPPALILKPEGRYYSLAGSDGVIATKCVMEHSIDLRWYSKSNKGVFYCFAFIWRLVDHFAKEHGYTHIHDYEEGKTHKIEDYLETLQQNLSFDDFEFLEGML